MTFQKLGLFVILYAWAQICPAKDSPLYAGISKINITPKTTETLHDSVYARCLLLESGVKRVAFISVDLAIFTSPRIKALCFEKYGIQEVFISSSHTHSEPMENKKMAFQGNSYVSYYEDQIMKAIDEAHMHLFQARIAAAHTTFPQLGFNRLIVREDGHSRESWFGDAHYKRENPERIPFGPVDPELGVIRIDDLNGQPRVILMNYACHADIVCFNYAISADYPGVASKKVEEAFGKNLICLFIQGGAGNIESLMISARRSGPDDAVQTNYEPMERTGELLAYETVKLARKMKPSGSQSSFKSFDDSLRFRGRFDTKIRYDVRLSTLILNDSIVIAACPGELFVQLQLEWKHKIREAAASPFLFGYTWSGGTWPGYIADVRSAAQGGYGADQGGSLIEVGAGEAIITKQLENYYRLSGLMRPTPGP